MHELPDSLKNHRVRAQGEASVIQGRVRFAPAKSIWFTGMAVGGVVGGAFTFSWGALALFATLTASVLLFGHSLGSHRKLIHNSFQCPRWLERWLVWMGVQVGLAGPIGLLRQHELRDYAQRLADCHPYLRHGSPALKDAWWQLHCELHLDNPPELAIEPRIASDRFYLWLERTWMLQQLPPALLLFVLGGWSFVFWGVCARIAAGVFGHWLIGYFAHNHGAMHHVVEGAAVQGRNIPWTSLLTMGECWHNNHHAFPGSARLGLAAGEWDPGWWVLMALRRKNLVWELRLPHQLPQRAELRTVGSQEIASEVPESTPSIAWLWRHARGVAGDMPMIRTPGAHASASVIRQLVGREMPVIVDRTHRRLALRVQRHAVVGLPGLWLGIARRSPWLRVAMFPLLLPAVAAERLRQFLTPDLASS